ncbi:hypothetical protein CSKR_112370 [Clonorchis sinensis]|uniref:Uncharacterized protein n=1 Tax=Clonorchis sinensis TaxID=79923 RepID=A0A3R7FYX7_CLOSI|nr:hypothetical protein CSKR_112370 [Clonorchis sinensis]
MKFGIPSSSPSSTRSATRKTDSKSLTSFVCRNLGCYASSGLTGSMDDLGLAAARNKALALLLGAPHKQAQPPTHRYAPPRSLPTH